MRSEETFAILAREGCSSPRRWSNAAGDRHGEHHHPDDKVLFCLEGSIVFPLPDGDIEWVPAIASTFDRERDTPPPVEPMGCTCVKGSVFRSEYPAADDSPGGFAR